MFNFFRPLRAKEALLEKPKHIAIIMDGNGRWAKKRLMPRISGHKKGLESVRTVITQCQKLNIPFLTLFAFSTENWLRPTQEVNFLMSLFQESIKKESSALIKHNVRFKLIGDRKPFPKKLVDKIKELEKLTEKNTGLTLSVAINYGGRWDIVNAVNKYQKETLSKKPLTQKNLIQNLSLNYAPDPDLLIRTGGEKRISNFLIWQFSYSELYFTETLWPDFNESTLMTALLEFQKRERRYGKTSEQL
ncbi:isoprenyl transferase [Candidatus Methylopumilus universalis]|uniref:isoprenyl transferase n=1 Tax=Candidatus Methylopumilus universalis TaxID=2588536 RepID=UPI001CB94FBF|nr:isoprenyl transferase [Candidatus Methylopumilus universalis]